MGMCEIITAINHSNGTGKPYMLLNGEAIQGESYGRIT